MANKQDIIEEVDFLVNSKKTITGTPEWQRTAYPNQYRWLATTAINSLPSKLKLVVDAYPNQSPLTFTLNILCSTSIMRLDYGQTERHNNRKVKNYFPTDLDLGWIYGSHLHSWNANRVLATNKKLPEKLSFAEVLPKNVKNFYQAFRFFCGKANITISENLVPQYPEREYLL